MIQMDLFVILWCLFYNAPKIPKQFFVAKYLFLEQNNQIWDEPLCSGHISIAATFSRSRWCPLERGSTVTHSDNWMQPVVLWFHHFLVNYCTCQILNIRKNWNHLNQISFENIKTGRTNKIFSIHSLSMDKLNTWVHKFCINMMQCYLYSACYEMRSWGD